MTLNLQALIANLAVVALFISVWVSGQFLLAGQPKLWRHVSFGVAMGLGAVCSMLLAIQFEGSLLDLRQSLVAIAAFFGGPVAGLIASGIAIAYRAWVGGPMVVPAAAGIALAALVGWVVSRAARRRVPALAAATLLAITLAVAGIALSIVVSLLGSAPLARSLSLTLPISLMNMVATFISALTIMRERMVDRERRLLRAAFAQSQDLRYVKTATGRYAAASQAMASTIGQPLAAIVGKTDDEVLPPAIAAEVKADDAAVIASGKGYVEREDMHLATDGSEVWQASSKQPLYGIDGDFIGIAGVTRDITLNKTLRREVADGHRQLNQILSEIGDGIALYDRQGTLSYCNEQFAKIFPLTSSVRRRGQHIRDILQAVVETGEQKGVPEGGEELWIDQVAETLSFVGGRNIELFDGRWLNIRTRPVAEGSSLVVVTDITATKQAQEALESMAERLKLLAATDGLTGLANRRSFDETLEREVGRSRRTGLPVGLLLSDVDRFKAYNDIYGHLAGDDVLRSVAGCLKQALRRPSDLAARYGGEEFVAILPETNHDGALFIADEFRDRLHALGIPHKGGDAGIVTASIGVAILSDAEAGVSGADLVQRADDALYLAKSAGRDCCMIWSGDAQPRQAAR